MTDERYPSLDENIAAYAGFIPEDFNERATKAHDLGLQAFKSLGYDIDGDIDGELLAKVGDEAADALIFAAICCLGAASQGRGIHRAAFTSRVRQIINWCQRPQLAPTDQTVLEGKVLELGRRVAHGLFPGDEFILILMNQGTPLDDPDAAHGHASWASSVERGNAIQHLRDLIEVLERQPPKVDA